MVFIDASAVAASSPTLSSTTSTPTTAPTDVPQMTPIATPASSSKVNAGAIAGGVVGGLFLLTGIGLAIFWFIVRKRRQRAQVPPSERYHPDFGSEPMPMSPQMGQHLLDRSTIATSPSISPRPYHAHVSLSSLRLCADRLTSLDFASKYLMEVSTPSPPCHPCHLYPGSIQRLGEDPLRLFLKLLRAETIHTDHTMTFRKFSRLCINRTYS